MLAWILELFLMSIIADFDEDEGDEHHDHDDDEVRMMIMMNDTDS